MSKFLVDGYQSLEPYVPGEQPQGQKFIKLNTNESPYPASERVVNRAREILRDARLYPDPDYVALREALAVVNEVRPSQIVVGNGSDEILNLAFMAFCDKEIPAVYPEISYGFYPVFAQGNQVASIEIPLCDDFTIDPQDYCFPEKRATIVIANPNAPTGIALSVDGPYEG